jgi:hypothetical protein
MAAPKFAGRAAKPLRRLLQANPGWTVAARTGSGHWRFVGPTGEIAILPATFYDGAMTKRWQAYLRRAARTPR